MTTMLRTGWLLVCLAAPAFVAAEQSRREHAAHVHGHATGTLAEDSGRWQLMLELPGFNLVGFEHEPADDRQRQRLDEVRAYLAAGEWLEPDPRSGCHVASSEVETRGYGVAENAGTEPDSGAGAHRRHDHDHDHDQNHEHEHAHEAAEDDHAHAAFRVEAVIRCDGPRRMRWLVIDLFERFPDNRSLRVDVLSESGAASHRLDRDDFRIRFD